MIQNDDRNLTAQDVSGDSVLVERLRHGDETAFMLLVERYQTAMRRVAELYVKDAELASEVVQETWIAVLRGLERFEGRSSLKTWIFSILTNRAKTRAQRENRSIPLSELTEPEDTGSGPTVEPERFANPRYPGHWRVFPDSWDAIPEAQLLAQETTAIVRQAIQNLPSRQRDVIVLRDVDELPSDEVCNLLTISETNQRVLLHRARAAVRRALEQYFANKE